MVGWKHKAPMNTIEAPSAVGTHGTLLNPSERPIRRSVSVRESELLSMLSGMEGGAARIGHARGSGALGMGMLPPLPRAMSSVQDDVMP